MSRSLITDEMVEAANRAYWDTFSSDKLIGMNDPEAEERIALRAALEAIEPMLMKAFAGEVSLGSDWQIEDPRINYVDVQVDKEFYLNLRAAE